MEKPEHDNVVPFPTNGAAPRPLTLREALDARDAASGADAGR